MIKNKRYNRLESESDHIYLNDYGSKGLGQKVIYGYIKCKLVHANNFSVIIPDQIYFSWEDSIRWIQPYIFLPCKLFNFDDEIICDISFDISFGYSVKARFKASDLLKDYEDGSQLYKCELLVPDEIGDYAIGNATIDQNWEVALELFHHTQPKIKDLILSSKHLLGSKWNIQGTSELSNSEHVYFTSLHEIKMNRDLEKIAMSHEAEIKLIRDNFNPPHLLLPGWKEKYKNDFLLMKVYREKTLNRTSSLNFMVPAEYITPQHILKHSPNGEPVYYEISAPYIHRTQIQNGATLKFKDNIIQKTQDIRFHKFIIIGDATRLDGLQAPFDEENTNHIFKIEFLRNQSMLQF
jgi:hypothetical protein